MVSEDWVPSGCQARIIRPGSKFYVRGLHRIHGRREKMHLIQG